MAELCEFYRNCMNPPRDKELREKWEKLAIARGYHLYKGQYEAERGFEIMRDLRGLHKDQVVFIIDEAGDIPDEVIMNEYNDNNVKKED